MSRHLVALPQNESHVESLEVLVPRLSEQRVLTTAIDLDGVFHQGIELGRVPGLNVRTVDFASAAAFYRLSPLAQLRMAHALASRIRSATHDADILLAFNDGALQRIALQAARRRGARTALLVDGMVSRYARPNQLPRELLRRVGRYFAHTGLTYAFPSEIGLSPVDLLFVVGPHSAEVLAERGASADRILPTGLVRFPSERSIPGTSNLKRVLYLTGAFSWHGDPVTSRNQLRDAIILRDVTHALGLELRVRVHPRDDVDPYNAAGLEAYHPQADLADAISDVDVVVSLVSTGMLEAVALGRPSLTLCITPEWRRFERSFAADPVFGAIRSAHSLRTHLAALASGGYRELLERQRVAYRRYVSASGPQAADAIVGELTA